MEGDAAAAKLALGAIWFVAFLFSTTLHEAAHAFTAWRLGDPTAYHGGQVSLSPLPHIRREPFGMVLVPILSFAFAGWMFGWASAPYDPMWAHRHPRRAGLMALAGPLANLLLVLLSGLALRVGLGLGGFERAGQGALDLAHLVVAPAGGAVEGVATLLSVLFSLNLILFLFNLFPLPPMDGSGVLQIFLPEGASRRFMEWTRHPVLSLVGLVVAWRLFPYLFFPVFVLALALLYAGS